MAAFAAAHGTKLQHVKTHGALYNMAAKDYKLARAMCEGAACVDPNLIVLGLANSEWIHAGKDVGVDIRGEIFADRSLSGRRNPGPPQPARRRHPRQKVRHSAGCGHDSKPQGNHHFRERDFHLPRQHVRPATTVWRWNLSGKIRAAFCPERHPNCAYGRLIYRFSARDRGCFVCVCVYLAPAAKGGQGT